MRNTEVFKVLKSSGLPVAYGAFKTIQKLPYIEYTEISKQTLKGDNHIKGVATVYNVNLFTDGKDSKTEDLIDRLLDDHEMLWSKIYTMTQKGDAVQVIYRFTEFER